MWYVSFKHASVLLLLLNHLLAFITWHDLFSYDFINCSFAPYIATMMIVILVHWHRGQLWAWGTTMNMRWQLKLKGYVYVDAVNFFFCCPKWWNQELEWWNWCQQTLWIFFLQVLSLSCNKSKLTCTSLNALFH